MNFDYFSFNSYATIHSLPFASLLEEVLLRNIPSKEDS